MAVSVDSKLLAPARTTAAQAERFLIPKPNGEYTDADVRFILAQYFMVGPSVGLDPLLAIAQMGLETAFLSSFWAARPRRNPAGIGVTGEPGAGISFPSWKVSVRAHLGRLLAYALPANTGTAAQKALIAEALAFRPLPASKRGSAPTVKGLAKSWAADPAYADKIVNIANAMLKA
jgi:Mannosyl-glycoprotein endo-beta-N-acetylglucosaminidase